MAARAGQVEVVRCLLRNGALVDARARVGVLLAMLFVPLKTIAEGITTFPSSITPFFSVTISYDSARQMHRKVCGDQGGCSGCVALMTHSI